MTDPERTRGMREIGRRRFLRRSALLTGAAALTPLIEFASDHGDVDAVRAGLLLPEEAEGGSAAASAVRGAELGAAEAGRAAELLGRSFEMVVQRRPGPALTRQFLRDWIERERLCAVVGGFDDPSASLLDDTAEEHGVLFLNAGSTRTELRASCGRNTFHIEASESMYNDSLARWTAEQEGPVSPATLSSALWHPDLERFGAGQLNDRFRRRFNRGMEGPAWATWMAAKVIWESAARARSTESEAMASFLTSARGRFDGHKGMPLSFRAADHQLRQPLYLVLTLEPGSQAMPALAGEVPRARRSDTRRWDEILDDIGTSDSALRCEQR